MQKHTGILNLKLLENNISKIYIPEKRSIEIMITYTPPTEYNICFPCDKLSDL